MYKYIVTYLNFSIHYIYVLFRCILFRFKFLNPVFLHAFCFQDSYIFSEILSIFEKKFRFLGHWKEIRDLDGQWVSDSIREKGLGGYST